MFDSPLDRIRIASPCKSDWNQMYGDDRRRFCSECKLNVHNLSGMTRNEAETLLMNSDGSLCVRFYRRRDGTVLTQDCPVGWKALKRKASRTAVAACSLIAGVFAGLFSVRGAESALTLLPMGDVPALKLEQEEMLENQEMFSLPVVGEFVDYTEWEGRAYVSPPSRSPLNFAVGQVEEIDRVEDRNIKRHRK
jgi:hypothetical protein